MDGRARSPMTRHESRGVPSARPLAAALLLVVVPGLPCLAGPPPPPAARLAVVERVLAQDQGDWQVDYCLKNVGEAPLAVSPSRAVARVGGWLSNSKVAVHAT